MYGRVEYVGTGTAEYAARVNERGYECDAYKQTDKCQDDNGIAQHREGLTVVVPSVCDTLGA